MGAVKSLAMVVGFVVGLVVVLGCTFASSTMHGDDLRLLRARSDAWQTVPWDHDLGLMGVFRNDGDGSVGVWQWGYAHGPGAHESPPSGTGWEWRLDLERPRLTRVGVWTRGTGPITDDQGRLSRNACSCSGACRCVVFGEREIELRSDGSMQIKTGGVVVPGPFLPMNDASRSAVVMLGERIVAAVGRDKTTRILVATGATFSEVASLPMSGKVGLAAVGTASVAVFGESGDSSDANHVFSPYLVNVEDKAVSRRPDLMLGRESPSSYVFDKAGNLLVRSYLKRRRIEATSGRVVLAAAFGLLLGAFLFGVRAAWSRRYLVGAAAVGGIAAAIASRVLPGVFW